MSNEWRDEVRRRLAGRTPGKATGQPSGQTPGETRDRHLEPMREAEIVEELALHVEQRYVALCDAGDDPKEARRTAFAEILGDAETADAGVVRELARLTPRRGPDPIPAGGDSPGAGLLASLWSDLRYGARMLRSHPSITTIVTLTLALGIGANVAIFSVANAVLLRPLPFPQPDRLVRLFHQSPELPGGRQSLSVGDFLALRDHARTLSALAVYRAPSDGVAYRGPDRSEQGRSDQGRSEQVFGVLATAQFFTVVGVPPLLGRTFQPGDDAPGAERVVVISHGFWQRRLNGDASIVGRAIALDGEPWRVIGVMPPDFWFPRGTIAEFWGNLRVETPKRLGPWGLQGIARLRPDAPPAQIDADLDVAARALREAYPGGARNWTFAALSMRDLMVGDVRMMLWVLLGAVGVVLLIACANVANLLLARATGRESEMALRAALGASRWRLVRQLLCESVMLATLGGVAGLALGYGGLRAFLAFGAAHVPLLRDLSIAVDTRVLVATALATLATGIIAGLAPALLMSRAQLSGGGIEAGRSMTESGVRRRARSVLVVGEIALSLMLLVCAGLLLRSLAALHQVDVGVRTADILSLTVSLPPSRYRYEQITPFHDRLLEDVRALPGVTQVGSSFGLPMGQVLEDCNFLPSDLVLPDGAQEPLAAFIRVGGDYFPMLGIPLRRGRLFDARDVETSPPVVIINEAFARQHFPRVDPLTRGLRIGGSGPFVPIVGVVGDVRYAGLQTAPEATMYTSVRQDAQRHVSLVVHTQGDPQTVVSAVRGVLARIDPDLALVRVQTFDEIRDEAVASPRFRTALLGLFALTALMLALIGIYGVLAFSVAQRTREMGIRLALGGTARNIVSLVLRQGLTLAVAGVVLGLGGAYAATRLLATLLFGVTPTDPLTFVAAPALLIAVALLACYVPARRASRIEPTVALRGE